MHESFTQWRPHPSICMMYDIDAITWDAEGITFTLIPDSPRREAQAAPAVRLCWPHVASYRVTEESCREDCWIDDPNRAWSFFISDGSPELVQLRAQSSLLPAGTRHYLLVGTNLVVDVFSETAPTVSISGIL